MTKKARSKTKKQARRNGNKKVGALPKRLGAEALKNVAGGARPPGLATIHEGGGLTLHPNAPIHIYPPQQAGGTGFAPPKMTGNALTRGAKNVANAWNRLGTGGKVGVIGTVATTSALGAGLLYRPIKSAIDRKNTKNGK